MLLSTESNQETVDKTKTKTNQINKASKKKKKASQSVPLVQSATFPIAFMLSLRTAVLHGISVYHF